LTARIGADDVAVELESPLRALLRRVCGCEPEPDGLHVLLDKSLGTQSTQRIAISDVGGNVQVSFWPAELKPQALYFYSGGRAIAAIEEARRREWDVRPSPHLAFFTSPPSRRLYMSPAIDAVDYARRWQESDIERVVQYSREEVRRDLWPWLKERGYATEEDAPVLEEFPSNLGRRPAHLRPGLRFKKRWPPERDEVTLGDAIRADVDAVLAAADEPRLPSALRR
jgi:hypothetical protein